MKNTLVLQELLDSLTSKAVDAESAYVKTKDQKYKQAAKYLYNSITELENAIDIIDFGL